MGSDQSERPRPPETRYRDQGCDCDRRPPVGGDHRRRVHPDDDLQRDGHGPDGHHDDDEETERDADAGRERRVRALVAARGEDDRGHEREDAAHERVQRPLAVVGPHGRPDRGPDQHVGQTQRHEHEQAPDDADQRREPCPLHALDSGRSVFNGPGLCPKGPLGWAGTTARRSRAGSRAETPTTGAAEPRGMGFGDTAKKIQRVTDIAEKLYERLNQVIEQVQDLKERVESTSDQLDSMDRELAEQRAIVEALAEQQGVDAEAVVAERLPDPEGESESEGESDGGSADGETTGATADAGTAEAASDGAATDSNDSAATND